MYHNQSNIKTNTALSNKIIREKICYLFQNFALVDDESVDYNLNLALEYRKGSKKEKLELKENALKMVGLNGYLNKKIYTLSGGEQQRISIARAILKPNKIILADEPTGNLDTENASAVFNILKNVAKLGITVIVVTHDADIAGMCDRILELSDGKLKSDVSKTPA